MALGVDVDGIVGTGGYAGLASDAFVSIEVNNAVGASVHGGCWTCVNAGRLVTLVAAGDLEVSLGVGEAPNIHLLHVSTSNPQRDAVFLFAGNRTGMTADAPVLVYDFAPFYVLCDVTHWRLL